MSTKNVATSKPRAKRPTKPAAKKAPKATAKRSESEARAEARSILNDAIVKLTETLKTSERTEDLATVFTGILMVEKALRLAPNDCTKAMLVLHALTEDAVRSWTQSTKLVGGAS